MSWRALALVGALLLTAAQPIAQRSASPSDPITGTWTGELIPQGAQRSRALTMTLKFDGKRAVSGTVSGLPNPADVKKGTFDPETGDLMLQLGIVGQPAVLLELQGVVVKGTATGHVTGDGPGVFKITRT
jgi:hypothetical protein